MKSFVCVCFSRFPFVFETILCQNVFWFLSDKFDSSDLYWKINGMLLKEV